MTKEQMLFLKVLAASLSGEKVPCGEITKDFWFNTVDKETVSWKGLQKITREQAVTGLIHDYMLTWELNTMPDSIQENLQKQTFVTVMMYYQMANFVLMVLELMEREKIHGCILKGVGLGVYYPKEELRKTGDVDLYIPVSEEFEAFCQILRQQGFRQEKSITDHHVSFYYTSEGIKFELEVHKKPINSQTELSFNRAVEKIFQPFSRAEQMEFPKVEIINGKIPVLPVEENAFYLLLHMLQHFLGEGMGIRLLCDWVVFLRKEKMSSEKFLSMVRQSKIEGFAYMITGLCIAWLGLSREYVPWMEGHMPKTEEMELFLKDMFDGGEFGGQDSSRMLITMEKFSFLSCLKELHRQMHLRFQRAGKFPFFWPFLWSATGLVFIYNNRHLRKTSAKNIIRSAKERSRLLESLRLFMD